MATGRSNASTKTAEAAESLQAVSGDSTAFATEAARESRDSMIAAKALERSENTSEMYLGRV